MLTILKVGGIRAYGWAREFYWRIVRSATALMPRRPYPPQLRRSGGPLRSAHRRHGFSRAAAWPPNNPSNRNATRSGAQAFAAGLEIAHRIRSEGKLDAFVKQRYSSFDSGDGDKFEKGRMKLDELAGLAVDYGRIGMVSGKQERLENLVNQYLLGL